MPSLPRLIRVPTLLRILAAPALAALLLSGCGGTRSTSANPPVTSPPPGQGIAVSGHTLSGSKPLARAAIQLYAAGTAGNGSAPASLSSSATSDTSGSFTIPAGYTCPSPASQLYLVARGGSLASSPTSNTAIALIAALGRCDSLNASSAFVLNEATTAATAWALSQFLSPGPNIGASATNTTGLANAVATALSLTASSTGVSPGPTFPATGTSPAPRINALANLLNTCVASASTCPQLFSLASSPGQPAPANTLDAALSLVRSPARNVSALFTLSQTSSAFSPTLPAAPADWTLPITFTGGAMNAPGPLAVDSNGNVWVASYFGVASRFSPIGSPTFASGITGFGLSESYGLAIDTSDNVWITDEASPSTVNGGFGAVTVLSSSGQPLSGTTGFASGGLNYPLAVALDPNGTAWVVDYGNSHLTQFNISGQPLSGTTGFFSNLFAFPVAIALDASHNAWIANMGGNSVTRVSSNGQQFTDFPCCNSPSGLALDASGNVWVANYLGDSISELSSSGTVISSGYKGGGLLHPQGIAIDGAGDVWVTNFRGNSISELAGAGSPHPGQILSPAAGWAPTPTSLQTFALAIDSSGNIWSTNFAANSLTEIVGLAAPVKTPLSALPQAP